MFEIMISDHLSRLTAGDENKVRKRERLLSERSVMTRKERKWTFSDGFKREYAGYTAKLSMMNVPNSQEDQAHMNEKMQTDYWNSLQEQVRFC